MVLAFKAFSNAAFITREALEAKRYVDYGNKEVYFFEYTDHRYGPMSNMSWPGIAFNGMLTISLAVHHTLDRMKMFWEQYNPVGEEPKKNLQAEMIVNFVKTL